MATRMLGFDEHGPFIYVTDDKNIDPAMARRILAYQLRSLADALRVLASKLPPEKK